jgi:cephalosporin hydroxylase
VKNINKRVRFAPPWSEYGWQQACGLIELCVFISKNINQTKKLRLVEVGSHLGESACIFASVGIFEKIWAVDIWSNNDIFNIFQENVNRLYPNIIIPKQGTSEKISKEWSEGPVDVVYIDANHSYESVINDINYWKKHLSANGIIAGHDYNPSAWPGVVRAVNESFADRNIFKFKDKSWAVINETSKERNS